MSNSNPWQCPYCGCPQILSDENRKIGTTLKGMESNFVSISEYGDVTLQVQSIACLNLQCKKLTLKVGLSTIRKLPGLASEPSGTQIKSWDVLPESMAKPQPEYIPAAIRQDYEEASGIVNRSPKAAATLARRCLQGMIRDFCSISEKNLWLEIAALKKQLDEGNAPHGVTPESLEAIDDVRGIGNIGAHMESDVNVIIDVDPDEAALLITLIEMLFKEWYVSKHAREENLKNLKKSNTKKQQQRKQSTQQTERQNDLSEASTP